MKTQVLLAASAVIALTASAAAEEVRVERKQVCTCTMSDGKDGGPTWDQQGAPGAPHVRVIPGGGQGEDVDVQVFKDGGPGEQRVIVIRRDGSDSADENKDGKVSRKEFLARAEKHFAELDRDHNGALEKDEMHPPMPPMPPLPPGMAPMPPVPPVPPVPPAPPAPPAN